MSKRFPSNPYEDVTPSEFNKSNKKHASEYFIAENFKSYGWFVYEPFTDTGIDRIIENLTWFIDKMLEQCITSLSVADIQN